MAIRSGVDSGVHGVSFQGVVKAFGGIRVVDDVSVDCPAGEIVALLGENGAGKSTLIKMLAGVYRRDGGTIAFNGQDADSPRGREGLAFIHQDLGLVDWMTVAENMALGYGFGRHGALRPYSKRFIADAAEMALEMVGGGIDPNTRVFDLTRSEKSLLAIARALAKDAKFLVLDEPTASLPHADVERLFIALRGLKERNVGMIYVSHRLDEIFEISDRAVVLRNGRLVGDVAVQATTRKDLISLIVGRELERVNLASTPERTAPVRLRLNKLVVGDVGPVELELRAGEAVGLIGLRGAGQTSIGRAVAGVDRVTDGRLEVDGTAVSFGSPRAAAESGVAFATSNRESEGLANGLSVRENIFTNPAVWGRKKLKFSSRKSERAAANQVIAQFGVRPAQPEQVVNTLSGGNQQKVILSRWLGVNRSVLVLEEPTMGVDVGAKADIYQLLAGTLEAGTAALIVSTDFEEVATICHRAIVFSRGRQVAVIERDQLTIGNLLAAASAGASNSAIEPAIEPSIEPAAEQVIGVNT